jgi:2-oxoisovalerate ferredoxin oxidoreductase beta subunit
LCDNKNIMRARRAIRKALELQRENAGFAFVEILSPCPTIWGKDPVEARAWVSDGMIPVFPLSVFRDRKPEIPAVPELPQRPVAEVLELNGNGAAQDRPPTKSNAGVRNRSHQLTHLAVKIAGFGGQGVLLLGQLLTEMGMREHLEVSWLPSYGPEMRSGSAHCHVCLSTERIGSPLVSAPDVLVAMNELSLRKFAPDVARGGLVLYNGSSLPIGVEGTEIHIVCIPAGEIADVIGSAKAANIVMLGALLEATQYLSAETAFKVLETKVKKIHLLEVDRKALDAGRDYIDQQVNVGAVSQPDGFA